MKSMSRFHPAYSMKNILTAAAIGLLTCTAPNAIAEDITLEKAQSAVEARQKNFKSMEDLLKPLIGMARGKSDMDASIVTSNAQELAKAAQSIEELYALDTGGFEIKNRSDEKIWSDLENFLSLSKNLETAAMALETAGQTGDTKKIKKAIMAVGKSCKSCHTEYRTE